MGFTWSQTGQESSVPCGHGEQGVCKGGALGAANAGSRAAASLERHSRALLCRYWRAVLGCCGCSCMTCAGCLRCRLLLGQGRAAWGRLGPGRLRWRARAGAQVPLQLLCIAAERSGGHRLRWCPLQSQWPAALHIACICHRQQSIPALTWMPLMCMLHCLQTHSDILLICNRRW